MNAKDIVVECLKHNIPVVGVQLIHDSANEIGYEISGFAKCGNVIIYDVSDISLSEYDKPGDVCVLQRYGQSDYINTFKDLAIIAYRWNEQGLSRGFSIDPDWEKVFQCYGWIDNE